MKNILSEDAIQFEWFRSLALGWSHVQDAAGDMDPRFMLFPYRTQFKNESSNVDSDPTNVPALRANLKSKYFYTDTLYLYNT